MIVQKGGQVTKPIIVVKMPCKLLYVIQVKGFIKCSTSWPYLISEVLVAYNHCGFLLASHFFTARLFLFSISLLFVSIQKQNILSLEKKFSVFAPRMFLDSIWLFVEAYETDATLKS